MLMTKVTLDRTTYKFCRYHLEILAPLYRMRRLGVIFRFITTQLLTRDADPPCYDTCKNALVLAQSIGYTPSLCTSNSTFYGNVSVCNDCLNSTLNDAAWQIVGPDLLKYANYCRDLLNSTESKFRSALLTSKGKFHFIFILFFSLQCLFRQYSSKT